VQIEPEELRQTYADMSAEEFERKMIWLSLRNHRRDVVISVILGCLAEFAVWFPTYNNPDPYTAERYAWLVHLQRPGVSVAYFVAWRVWYALKPGVLLLPAYVGSACGFAVLVALWSAIAFSLLLVAKHLQLKTKSK
jgi:hypothetical protein